MKDAGLYDGDILMVDVLAVVNGKFTVKRLYRKGGRIQPVVETL